MKKLLIKRRKELILIGLTLATVLFFGAEKALARDNDNVSGWAWSENIGWISFNNLNCDPDDNGRSNGLPPGCPPAGTEIGRYGVNVDLAGILSGYAWSEHIGWISFNKADTGNPPALPYIGESYIAKINWTKTPPEVSGWARVMSVVQNPGPAQAGGWSGWIKLRGANYGIWIDTGVDPAESNNFAWADQVVGWISFNHKNCDPDSDGVSEGGLGCPAAGTLMNNAYKVIIRGIANNPPEVINLKSRELDPCLFGAAFILSWRFRDKDRGDSQSAYQVQIDDNPSFSSVDDDSCSPAPGTCSPGHNSDSYTTTRGRLEYNTTYYWRVKVWDQRGAESEWSEIDSFATTPHQWPAVNFVWTPARPSIEEYAQFWDQSQVFVIGGDPGEITRWQWLFTNGDPSRSNEQNPESRFLTPGLHNVTLTVRDQDNFECEVTKQVPVTPPLPSWREIPPYTKPETFLPLKANFSWQGFRLSRLFAWWR